MSRRDSIGPRVAVGTGQAYGGTQIPAAQLARKIATNGIQVPKRLRNIA